jgi:hypothetical protein
LARKKKSWLFWGAIGGLAIGAVVLVMHLKGKTQAPPVPKHVGVHPSAMTPHPAQVHAMQMAQQHH